MVGQLGVVSVCREGALISQKVLSAPQVSRRVWALTPMKHRAGTGCPRHT